MRSDVLPLKRQVVAELVAADPLMPADPVAAVLPDEPAPGAVDPVVAPVEPGAPLVPAVVPLVPVAPLVAPDDAVAPVLPELAPADADGELELDCTLVKVKLPSEPR